MQLHIHICIFVLKLGLGLRNMRMMAIPARVKLPEDQLIPSESIMNAYKESALAKSNTKVHALNIEILCR